MAAGHAERAPPPRAVEASVAVPRRSRDRPAPPRAWTRARATGAVRFGPGECGSPGNRLGAPYPCGCLGRLARTGLCSRARSAHSRRVWRAGSSARRRSTPPGGQPRRSCLDSWPQPLSWCFEDSTVGVLRPHLPEFSPGQDVQDRGGRLADASGSRGSVASGPRPRSRRYS
jgi:hypothetical protein